MKFISFKNWLNEEKNQKVIILYPGSFKPIHYGHIELIKRYASHPDVKEVKVLIGPGIRNGIDQKISFKIANQLLIPFQNVSVEMVKYPSPILTAYKYMETAKPGIYAMASSKKGNDDEDYKRVLNFVKNFQTDGKYYHTLPKGVSVIELPVNIEPVHYNDRTDENEGKPISASILRRDVMNNDFYNFETNYPGYGEHTTRELWKILKPIITE